MRHIPSVKKLLSAFRDSQKAVQLRTLLVDWKNGDIKSREMLEEANGILGGHGVEYIRTADDDQHAAHGAYYVNMGDTYDTTILLDLDRGRVWVTGWGDWVEAEERAGKRFE
jgi:hypothetical protein